MLNLKPSADAGHSDIPVSDRYLCGCLYRQRQRASQSVKQHK